MIKNGYKQELNIIYVGFIDKTVESFSNKEIGCRERFVLDSFFDSFY